MDEKTAAVWIKLIATCGRVATAGIIAFFGWKSIEALAGQQTEALIDASLAYGNTNYALLAVTFLSLLWAISERKIREKMTKDLSDRNRKLEEQIDENRTSSNLLESGNTNPGDIP